MPGSKSLDFPFYQAFFSHLTLWVSDPPAPLLYGLLYLDGGFNEIVFFIPTWVNDPIGLYFFNLVSTTPWNLKTQRDYQKVQVPKMQVWNVIRPFFGGGFSLT